MDNPQLSSDSIDELFSSQLQQDNSEGYKKILHDNNIHTISQLSEMEAIDLHIYGIPIEIGSNLIEKARQDTTKQSLNRVLSHDDFIF
jgi:hypothetical protein